MLRRTPNSIANSRDNSMNHLTHLLDHKSKNLLNIFFTAGYPERDATVPMLKMLEDEGVDMVELGVPFSDPLADGPVIQESSKIALENGMTLSLILDQVKEYRKQRPNSKLPIILMGYLNPVLRYGMERFCTDAEAAGVDALIIPDLPMEVYEAEYQELFKKHHLSNIFLVTPKTSEERIRKIDQLTNGFIYAVSSASTTGSKSVVGNTDEYLNRLAKMNLESPILLGFNIKTKTDVQRAGEKLSGAIIGSAFIKAINGEDYLAAGKEYIQSLR